MKNYISILLAALVIVTGLWLARKEIYGLIVNRQLNEAVARFALQDLRGNPIDFTDFSGKVLVLEFWNTW